ncbi:uncharacterized protein CTRU02_208725 [Colletotrichum truncatum]|uniref:Uncharacterized protein n=1 Tax=Colletotrichum truncatum TaxID=5467 RepID=A0ACC3YX59_COLTU|nr:uncharacterized protein CTRU02_06618 [Colletotrichum truncatum]KAF6792535.1 hypothetical protein CTRU02_06618 [Colletotrichum truncatum]
MSSLSRAFTTRRVKQSIDLSDAARGKERSNNFMQRSKTTKAAPMARHKISAPMELVHTTNMLSYNAPDIRPRTSSSSKSSTKSSEEESEGINTAASSPPTSPDVAPHERSTDHEPNHLSCYFVAPSHAINPATAPEVPQIPEIPKRAPSHTKKASFDAVARSRTISTGSKISEKSISTKASMTFSSRASSGSSAASTMSHNSLGPAPKAVPPMPSPAFLQQQQPRQEKTTESHPFGRELAQVTEIAEEFGIKDHVMDEEERNLKAQGLRKFAAEDYLAEVQTLFTSFFPDTVASHSPQRPMAAAWI